MVAINPEMLRELLAEFTEKEAVNREEINVINQQLEELDKRITSNKAKLEGLAKDREKILAMQERYLSGKWKTSGKAFTASLQLTGGEVVASASLPVAPAAPQPEPVVSAAPPVATLTSLPVSSPAPSPASVPSSLPVPTVASVVLPEVPAGSVGAQPAPIEAAPVQVNVPSYQPPSAVSTGEVPVLARELVSPQAFAACEVAAPVVEAPSFDDPILNSFDGGSQPAVDLDTAFAAPQVEPQPLESVESGFSWASTAINEEASAPPPSPTPAWGEPSVPALSPSSSPAPSPAAAWGESSTPSSAWGEPSSSVASSSPWGEPSAPAVVEAPANPWGEPSTPAVVEAPANPWGEPSAPSVAEVSANPWGEPSAPSVAEAPVNPWGEPSAPSVAEVSANPWGEPSAPSAPQASGSPWGEFGDEEWGQTPAAQSQAADGGWEQASAWGASGDANVNVPSWEQSAAPSSPSPASPPATNAWAPAPSSQEETSSDAAWGQVPPTSTPPAVAAPANPWGEPSEPAAEPAKSSLAKAADGALISPIRSRRKPAPSFDWGGGDSSQDQGNS